MTNRNFTPVIDILLWIDICAMCLILCAVFLLAIPWYLTVIFALVIIIAVITTVLIFRKMNSDKEIEALEKKMRTVVKKAKKNGDVSLIYDTIEKDFLTTIRNKLPQKIYKYYQLSDDVKGNEQKLNSVRNNTIWASTCYEFNDPYECQFLYLNEDTLVEMGIPNPQRAKELWDSIMEEIRTRITTICFTQNSNDMLMWAHYANNHKGFCVEYSIDNYKNFYPVIYSQNRINVQALFIELIYCLFNEEAKGKGLAALLKYIMFTSAFKDESWEAEHEIRAVFINSRNDMTTKGRLFNCETIGVHPTQIFIGMECSSEHEEKLAEIANELQIPYAKCELSNNESFQLVSKRNTLK